jgi:hypothetical protein
MNTLDPEAIADGGSSPGVQGVVVRDLDLLDGAGATQDRKETVVRRRIHSGRFWIHPMQHTARKLRRLAFATPPRLLCCSSVEEASAWKGEDGGGRSCLTLKIILVSRQKVKNINGVHISYELILVLVMK